jgi:hypothetical protein
VLEVVDHEQQLARRQPASQSRSRPLAFGDNHLERAGERRLDLLGGLKRGERDKPPPIPPTRPERGGDLSSQTGLAHPAGTGQGYQAAVAGEERSHVYDLALAPDEPGRRRRQIR